MAAKQKRSRDPVCYYQSPTASPPNKKRKSRRLPLRSHRPSQSSVDVPIAVKKEVKNSQGNRCWLCNQKVHKKNRPLEIAHLLPQAISKRFFFKGHHELGRTQLNNIHDRANLVALCNICHLAFDRNEWTFLPQELTTWIQAAKADPEKDLIRGWNSKRDIVFQRWRLMDDPESEASSDEHFVSSFTNEPLKVWPGEVGAVVLRNTSILSTPNVDLENLIGEFGKLNKIWMRYKNPCSTQECPICSPERDGNESDRDDSGQDEDGAEDDGGDDDGGGGGDGDGDNEGDKGYRYYQKNRGISARKRPDSAQNHPKTSHKSHRYETRQSSTLAIRPANRSMRATTRGHSKVQMPRISRKPRITRKTNRSSNHKKSALYDKSVPYSHREGYTWANTTANELMAIWQGLPYVKQADGQIIITQGFNYPTLDKVN